MTSVSDIIASFGLRRRMTAAEAISLGCCRSCRRDSFRDWTMEQQNEWNLSGLCPTCYADLERERQRAEDGCE